MSLTPDPTEARREANRTVHRKVRLAQTAPASMHHKHKKDNPPKAKVREAFGSASKDKSERAQEVKSSLDTDRKKSVYIQISGSGKEKNSYLQDYDSEEESNKKRKELPTPSPRTMLDVMIGLNAFSHVPPPRCATKTPFEIARDGRKSVFIPSPQLINRPLKFTKDGRATRRRRSSVISNSSVGSINDSTENIAEKFIQQWRSRVASRRQSICNKLAAEHIKPDISHGRESIALTSVPENEPPTSTPLRKASKWTLTHKPSLMPAEMPAITQDEEQERREQFQAWVRDKKDSIKPTERPDSAFLSAQQKTNLRRKSFADWLKKRMLSAKQRRNSDDDDDDEDIDTENETGPYQVDDGPEDIGDMLKTVLQIKKRFKDPVDFRLKKFYKDLDKIKERDDKARRPLTEEERKRKWKLLMKGIDAALADSSDEEDNWWNTV